MRIHSARAGVTPAGGGIADGGGTVVAAIAHGQHPAVAEWAAAEAAARGCALRLVHVRRAWPGPVELAAPLGLPAYSPYSAALFDPDRQDGYELLLTAMRHALGVAPELDASGELLTGPVRRRLRECAAEASLLVVGGSASPRWSRPTVLVPAVRSSAVPRVVLALDRSAAAGAALRFAFRAAEQRRVDLVVVPTPDLGRWDGPPAARWSAGGAGRRRAQARVLRALVDEGPRCPSVRWTISPERDAGAVAAVLRRCSLLVVPAAGRPGRGRAAALVEVLLGQAAPPIALVPAEPGIRLR